jgi:hypothetical protein
MKPLAPILLGILLSTTAQAQTSRQIQGSDIQNLGIIATGSTTARSLADRAAVVINIMDVGGSTAAADNSAAFNAALTLHNSTGRPIYFPAGVWKFTGAIIATLPNATDSLQIVGAAMDATILQFGATSGITINYLGYQNSTHWRDLTITTTGAGNGSAITLNQNATVANPANTALSDFLNVTMRGADGYVVSNYWTNGVLVSSVSNINFNNLIVVGNAGITSGSIGVNLTASASNFGVAYNFIGSTFNYLDKGIVYGTYIQGVTVVSSNFTGGNYGIYWGSGTGTQELVVNASQFNNVITGIYDLGGVQLSIIGNTFLLAFNSAYGINLTTPNGAIISNNYFQQVGSATGVFSIVDQAEGVASVITGNFFGNNTPAYWFPTASTTYPTILANNVYPASVTAFSLGASVTVVQDIPQTVATLPAASSTYKKRQAFVTDSNTVVWGATVAGGGANNVLVVCDGSAWTVMGK